jgi:sodium-dependent phosphate transporter
MFMRMISLPACSDVALEAPGAAAKDVKDVEGTAGSGSEEVAAAESGNAFQRALTGVKKQLTKSLTMDIHEGLEDDARVAELHANAEVCAAGHCFTALHASGLSPLHPACASSSPSHHPAPTHAPIPQVFDPHTEDVYKYLQVFSACAVSFAHGANDVANAIGAFAGIWCAAVLDALRSQQSIDVPCHGWGASHPPPFLQTHARHPAA